ncbi:unnamed protein product [Discula destructiva]
MIEHVKRHHTPTWNCLYCGHRWVAVTFNNTTLQPVRDEHVRKCSAENDGCPRVPFMDESEIMSEAQEALLKANVTPIRGDNARKLEALYMVCEKPLPETYHVRPLVSLQAPLRTNSNESSFLNGFVQGQIEAGGLPDDELLVVPSGTGAADSGYGGSSGAQDDDNSALDGESLKPGHCGLVDDLQYMGGADSMQTYVPPDECPSEFELLFDWYTASGFGAA